VLQDKFVDRPRHAVCDNHNTNAKYILVNMQHAATIAGGKTVTVLKPRPHK